MPAPRLLISACLCGEPCRYDGGAFDFPRLAQLAASGEALPVCPEMLGGLPCPRPPCERVGDSVADRSGNDFTKAYRLGAQRTLELAQKHGIRTAVLKERSPSCGGTVIHNGTFSRILIPGQGVAAALLAEHGIRIFNEDNYAGQGEKP